MSISIFVSIASQSILRGIPGLSIFSTRLHPFSSAMADEYDEKITTSSENKANGVLGFSDKVHVQDEKAITDQSHGDGYDVAVSKHGLKLHPQPTADSLDPLNWTSWRKHTILAIVMYL